MSRGLACDFGIALRVPALQAEQPTEWALIVDVGGYRTATYDTPTGIVFQCRQGRVSVLSKQKLSDHFIPEADAYGIIQRGVVHLSTVRFPCDIRQLTNIVLSVPVQPDSRRWVLEVLHTLRRDLQLSDLLRDPLGHHGEIFQSFSLVAERVNERFSAYIKKQGFRVAQFFL
ncbi:hypothetical protein BJ165DRAFT_1408383 [Panaeolus papilionaceus]|nr:hypothetical protein BJ165DRAFT_1408383 [Panaeolus papilionaceus]